jgi:CPA1 family monovalent cation:H+ antiporter
MHEPLLLCLALLLAVSLFVTIGQRLGVPTPIFLVLSGLALSLVPGIPPIVVDPELIFLLFLPPLLYEAAWFTSWKEFWRWRRIILVLAFGLVLFTALAVAYVSWAIIPGFTLALGFLLGGIISPPDAVAATSVLRNVKVSHRVISILEGESLINDASSLVVFRFALAAVLSGAFAWKAAAGSFLLVTLGGIGVGLGVAGVFYAVHRWLPTTTRVNILLTLMAPYFMYLAAEALHVSGVMAVVSGGLFLSYHSHQLLDHSTRIQGIAMWSTIVFALNGLVFILIGLELPVVVRGLGGYSKAEAIGYALLITLLIIVVRLGFTLVSSLFTRLVSRVVRVADANPGWRGPIIVGWAGMRGVVSLASALSVPLTLADGTPFPHRNLILFITFVVILVTLVFQGSTLPLIIRRVDYRDPDPHAPVVEQLSGIRLRLLRAALERVESHHAAEAQRNELVADLKVRLERDTLLTTRQVGSTESNAEKVARYNRVVADVIAAKRRELHRLLRNGEFDEDILREEEARLDLEEEKINHPIH